jgi:alkanesulfonate monooxygenase SsuD/methylene tetrahydromethanopterin reductase-like flavin-dependent oxidoreductase (luciferase family)
VVELAALTEVVGLDLATVQDHPYQARFLDVFALLGAILARTSALRVAPNVANLPLRPPYVLAKTLASLDVLHRGRIELALGVVRATWDTDQRSIHHDGEHYRVVGPTPARRPPTRSRSGWARSAPGCWR